MRRSSGSGGSEWAGVDLSSIMFERAVFCGLEDPALTIGEIVLCLSGLGCAVNGLSCSIDYYPSV